MPLTAEAVFLDLQRVAGALSQALATVLKPHGLSPTQYNVLRILRGSPAGLTCSQISTRMITHDPDVTRLADRLVDRGLASRDRHASDRRVIVIQPTEAGLALLAALDPVIAGFHTATLGQLAPKDLEALAALLAQVRAAT